MGEMSASEKRQLLAKAAKQGGYKKLPKDWLDSNRYGSDEMVKHKAELLKSGITTENISKLYSHDRPAEKRGQFLDFKEKRSILKDAFERRTGEKIKRVEAGKFSLPELRKVQKEIIREKGSKEYSKLASEVAKYREDVKREQSKIRRINEEIDKNRHDKKIVKKQKEKLKEVNKTLRELKKARSEGIKRAEKEVRKINKKLFEKELSVPGLPKAIKDDILNNPLGWKVFNYMEVNDVDLETAIDKSVYSKSISDRYDTPIDWNEIIDQKAREAGETSIIGF